MKQIIKNYKIKDSININVRIQYGLDKDLIMNYDSEDLLFMFIPFSDKDFLKTTENPFPDKISVFPVDNTGKDFDGEDFESLVSAVNRLLELQIEALKTI